MQGTQYAPRESILCMEHFVALHGSISKAFTVNIAFQIDNSFFLPKSKSILIVLYIYKFLLRFMFNIWTFSQVLASVFTTF